MTKSSLPAPSAGCKEGSGKRKKQRRAGGNLKPHSFNPPRCVTLRLGSDGKRLPFEADSIDQATLADIADQFSKYAANITSAVVEVGDLTAWSTEERERFWRLLQVVVGDGNRNVTLRVEDQNYQRPFDLAAACLRDLTDNPDERCRTLDLVAETLFYSLKPHDRIVHLDALIAGIRNRGYSSQVCAELRKNIHQRLRYSASAEKGDPRRGNGAGEDAEPEPDALALQFLIEDYHFNLDDVATGDDANDVDADRNAAGTSRDLPY